jgi:hypothetical protein
MLFWQSPEGENLLAVIAAVLQEVNYDSARGTLILKKRGEVDPVLRDNPALIGSGIDIQIARRRLSGAGLSWAGAGLFTKQSVQQSSFPACASFRAERFRGCRTVVDVCGGAGVDALALSCVAEQVIVCERDTGVAEMLRHNVAAAGATNVTVLASDFFSPEVQASLKDFPPVDGLWADPSRRDASGKRLTAIESYSPSVQQLVTWVASHPTVKVAGVKVSPRDGHAVEQPGWSVESLGAQGECKDHVLWLGEQLSGAALVDEQPPLRWSRARAGDGYAPERITEREQLQQGTLIELDATITPWTVEYAQSQSWAAIEGVPGLCWTPAVPDESPWYRRYAIASVVDFKKAAVHKALAELGWSAGVQVKKRGLSISAEEGMAQLGLRQGDAGVVLLTGIGKRRFVVCCRRL